MPNPSRRLDLRRRPLDRKHFWRCVPKRYIETILETGPSFTQERRYSVRGEFDALYFGGSMELCAVEAAGRAGEDGEKMVCVEFEITVDRLADLTQPETRTKLRVQLKDLVRPRISREAYTVPQRIARRLYSERFQGLIAPSVHDLLGQQRGWFNLVLYPAQLVRSSIREIRSQEVSSRSEWGDGSAGLSRLG
ncbi:MAG: RES family NAD+ phosphorylase [Terriglobia bacterium]